MWACFQPAACRSTISLRPWTVSRALPWDTRTSGRMWALDKPHPTRRFSRVQARPPSPTSWPGTTRRSSMAGGPVVLPTSGHAAWDDLATWWLSRYKISTQQTYATYLPRWTAWCAGRGLDPLQAGRADVALWLRTVADSGLSRASTAGHYDAVASIYRLAFDEDLIAINPCARIARPKVLLELQHREVLTVLEN